MISVFKTIINRLRKGSKKVNVEPIFDKKEKKNEFVINNPPIETEQTKILKKNLNAVKAMLSSGVHPNLQNNITSLINSLKFSGSTMALDSAEKKNNDVKVSSMDSIKNNLSFAMDDNAQGFQGGNFSWSGIPTQMYNYYLNQNFIGWTNCALMAQNWLIGKACLIPAEDCIRRGYDYVSKSGDKIDQEILEELTKLDTDYKLNYNMVNLIQFGRVFGIRVAMFIVDSDDDDYYFEPFNIDGIKPGTYKGICQIDPYWLSPVLDVESSGQPLSLNFYEPTYWNVTGKMVHRSHIVIYRTEEVADILKPTYVYGGVPIPQKMYAAVYQAEMIASELPYLVKTKRSRILKTDTSKVIANQKQFTENQAYFNSIWDNHGMFTVDKEDEDMIQLDTSLAECEAVCLLRYQLCASEASIPFTRLFETSPKGWQSSGSYEENSYRDSLTTMQHIALIPLAQRHHELVMKSDIEPKFGVNIEIGIAFKPLDALTSKELAELNKIKADTDTILSESGAIDGQDIRTRLINDPESGYTKIDEEAPEVEEDIFEENSNEEQNT